MFAKGTELTVDYQNGKKDLLECLTVLSVCLQSIPSFARNNLMYIIEPGQCKSYPFIVFVFLSYTTCHVDTRYKRFSTISQFLTINFLTYFIVKCLSFLYVINFHWLYF